ncbi:hypothetical protein FQA39_LY19196 [Lamprigera yunnana]|nr:hypothetical protein FQA39_LY19196 [Lamprigera yunnana]
MDISEDVIDVVHDHKDRGDGNEINVRTGNDEPRQKKGKGKAPDPTEALAKLTYKCLQQREDNNDKIAAAWAVEFQKMDPQPTVVREEGHP